MFEDSMVTKFTQTENQLQFLPNPSYIPITHKANEWFVNWALCNRTTLNRKLNLNHSLTNWGVNCTSLQPAFSLSYSDNVCMHHVMRQVNSLRQAPATAKVLASNVVIVRGISCTC